MIARIAERAIWLEKLDETTRESGVWRDAELRLRAARLNLVLLRRRDRLRPHLEGLVGAAPFGIVAPRPWTTASGLPIAPAIVARPASVDAGFGVTKVIWLPPLKSMPEVQPLDGERDDADEDDRARDREPRPALAHEVDLQELAVLLVRGAR